MLRPLLAFAAALAASVAAADTPVLPGSDRPTWYPSAAALDVSPDGGTAVTAFTFYENNNHRGFVRVSDVATGAVRADLPLGPASRVHAVRFTPDGTRVVAVYGDYNTTGHVADLDVATGRTLHTLDGFYGAVELVGFSADGTRLRVTNQDNPGPKSKARPKKDARRVETWDIVEGKRLAAEPWEAPDPPAMMAARTPDGKLVVTYHPDGKVKWGYDPKAGLFAVRPGAAPAVIPATVGRHYTRLAVSADGKTLLAAEDDATDVIDLSAGKRLRTLRDDTQQIGDVAFAAGGRLLFAAANDGSHRGKPGGHHPRGLVYVWDLKAGELRRVFDGFGYAVNQVFPSADGTRVTAVSGDRWYWHDFAVLDVVTGKRVRTVANPGHKYQHVAAAPGGRWLASARDDKDAKKLRLTVWDGLTGDELRTLDLDPAATGPHPELAFTADAQLVVHGATELTWWDVATSAKVKAWRPGAAADRTFYPRDTNVLALHPSGKAAFGVTATGNRRQSHNLWRISDTGRQGLGNFIDILSAPQVSPDGKWLALAGSESPGNDLFLTPLDADGMPAFADADPTKVRGGIGPGTAPGTVKVVPWRTWKASSYSVGGFAFAPDSRTLATGGGDHVVRLWDVATQKLKATLHVTPPLTPGAAPADWLAFTPDGFHAGTPRGRAFLRFRDDRGALVGAAERDARRHDPAVVRAALGAP